MRKLDLNNIDNDCVNSAKKVSILTDKIEERNKREYELSNTIFRIDNTAIDSNKSLEKIVYELKQQNELLKTQLEESRASERKAKIKANISTIIAFLSLICTIIPILI